MKLLKITILLFFISTSIFAQKSVLSFQTGIKGYFNPKNETFFIYDFGLRDYFIPIGVSYQHKINKKMVIGGQLEYHYQLPEKYKEVHIVSFEPRFDYYTTEAFNGFHIGPYLAVNHYTFLIKPVTMASVGMTVGYTAPITKKLNFDIRFNPGYDIVVTKDAKGSAITTKLNLGIGYSL